LGVYSVRNPLAEEEEEEELLGGFH